MAAIVHTIGLEKKFGRSPALSGLDLEVEPGEIHGFLGPNGAGKSTTIRILLGLIRPTAGTARVFGLDPWQEPIATHRDIAYVPGDVSLWPNLSGGETIDLLTNLRGGADPSLLATLLHDFEFDPRKKARTYSKGNRQKVALIAALARRAKLYILDEPTSGLDPVMESVFRRHIERARDDGATVLLSSHVLSEVEQLCDRVTIIRDGVAVESGSLESMRHLTRTTFRATGITPKLLQGADLHDVRQEGESVLFEADSDSLTAALERLAKLPVTSLVVAPPSLESLFLRHYESKR
jgi:ABC-2 type transport system ATP-binding protein